MTETPDDQPDLIGMHTGPPLMVHNPAACAGQFCSVHNPSQHPLRERPLNWRGHVMERICVHGIGHPDPDDSAWRKRTGQPVHSIPGCDGCCTGRRLPDAEPGRGPVEDDQTARIPWSAEQVLSLIEFQGTARFHPYTCGNRGDGNHPTVPGERDHGILTPTVNGWVCRFCTYTQGWAHGFTADRSWAA